MLYQTENCEVFMEGRNAVQPIILNRLNLSGMKITETSSLYDNLEQMSVHELLTNINKEDGTVHKAVYREIPKIEELVSKLIPRMKSGGRLFYLGAGTSGRLGVIDASEIPPTYGVPQGIVVGLIAGGDKAIRKAVESAEDDFEAAWNELLAMKINRKDTVIGIAASGGTPYVVGGIKKARENGLLTAGITCNPDSEISRAAEIAIEPIVGPEFVTGSTRMKAGTAQKMVLNMISTSVMIKLGRVKGNRMVDMQLSNKKLIERGTRMIVDELGIDHDDARRMLLLHGSVRKAIESYSPDLLPEEGITAGSLKLK
jgi:N-acetylmuramic acid 6-phosphate etherase